MKKSSKQDLCGAGIILLLFTAAAIIDTYPLAAGACIGGMGLCAWIGKLRKVEKK